MFGLLPFLFILSPSSAKVQKVVCEIPVNSYCQIDGSSVASSSNHMEISTPLGSIISVTFKNFKDLQLESFKEALKVQQVQVLDSNFTAISGDSTASNTKVANIGFTNSSVSLKNEGFTNFRSLENLIFENITFKEVQLEAFKGISSLVYFKVFKLKMPAELLGALKNLSFVRTFDCSKCQLDDEHFSFILRSLPAMETLTSFKNQITKLNCSDISSKLLETVRLDENFLNGTFRTCGILELFIQRNSIDTIHIQSKTTSIDASRNSISTIKCDENLQLKTLILSNNKLTSLQCVADISTLEELNIDSNSISFFEPWDFDDLSKLWYISAMDNPLKAFPVDMFRSQVPDTPLKRINVDKFDSGYEKLRELYPKLKELFHPRFNGSCEEYLKIDKATKQQKIMWALFTHRVC